MTIKNYKLYSQEDIEILENGISVNDTFLNKKDIADTFNELVFVRNFIEKQSNNENGLN